MKVFDIGIYRTTLEKFNYEYEKSKESKDGIDQTLWNYIDRINYIKDIDWYPWFYNDIIGYIRIMATPSEIEGTLFIGNYIKPRRSFKPKKIRYLKTLFHVSYSKYSNNEEFSNLMNNEIMNSIHKAPILKNRHIDIEAFECFSQFYDWGKLISLKNVVTQKSPIEILNDLANSSNCRAIYFNEEPTSHNNVAVDIDELFEKAKKRSTANSKALNDNTIEFLKELKSKQPYKYIELLLSLKPSSIKNKSNNNTNKKQ